MTCGIYKITNKVNNKCYIGQSIDIERRWKEHIRGSRQKRQKSLICKAIKKYGVNNFEFSILFECEKKY